MTPLLLPVMVWVPEFTFPVTDNEVPFAAPIFGVTNTGELLNTTLLVPVELVTPVPPLTTGNAVPDNETAIVPEPVIGLPEIDKNDGTESATEVTVPELGVDHVIAVVFPP